MEAFLTVSGHVGGEVELRRTQQTNTARASFRLACTPRIHRQGNWTDDPTTWLTVVCWRSLAEHVAASVAKGDPVVVVGRVRTQAWTDDDGNHERMVVEASTVGHDLTRGNCTFHKVQRGDRPLTEEPPDPEESAPDPADPDRDEVPV